MVAYTDTVGFNKGSAAFHTSGKDKVHLMSVDLDFPAIVAARSTASLTALGAADSLQVLQIPAKTYVLVAGIDVTTAEGGTLTLDLGDGDDMDGWLDGVDGNAVASYDPTKTLAEAAPNTIVGYSVGGKYYSAADTIDLTMVNATDTAVMRVWALCVNCA